MTPARAHGLAVFADAWFVAGWQISAPTYMKRWCIRDVFLMMRCTNGCGYFTLITRFGTHYMLMFLVYGVCDVTVRCVVMHAGVKSGEPQDTSLVNIWLQCCNW